MRAKLIQFLALKKREHSLSRNNKVKSGEKYRVSGQRAEI